MSSRGLVCIIILGIASAVDRSKFRKCGDTRFCRVHRNAAAPPPAFFVDPSTVALDDDTGELTLMLRGGGGPLAVSVQPHLDAGVVRVRIVDPARPRWEPTDVLLSETFALDAGAALETNDDKASLLLGDGSRVAITYAPFVLDLWGAAGGSQPLARLNAEQLLHFERGGGGDAAAAAATTSVEIEATGEEAPAATNEEEEEEEECADGTAWNGEACLEIAGYWEDGLARFADGSKEVKREAATNLKTSAALLDVSESFGGHQDSVKNGPTSVGADVTFPSAEALFGLAEHATGLALKPTTGEVGPKYGEPYRFYNLDVFEYELDEPMALYGSIPLAWGHSTSTGETVGAFWNNPSETFADVEWIEANEGRRVHWLSESGVIEVFFISGSPLGAMSKFASLVGAQELPPIFALGYHQCRWNYKDEKDVAAVHGNFEALDIPYDVLWLDIEHTDGKRYFTWDKLLFPSPVDMQRNLSKTGRKMVTIVDPHIKRDPSYAIHSEATRLGLYIKDKSGSKDFDGWCWPGSSSYLDFTSTRVREWWAERFSLENYRGSTTDLYTWNDMNEPSVFNGPEVTMSKECLSLDGVEHREWHNLYGMYFARATAEGLALRGRSSSSEREGGKRPFVLTRSFYAGSQRWGAMWTGDNAAQWSHLEIAAPMLLSISVCGFSFAGADAGGFFGDPDPELMTRWIQAAAYTPFFRGHAHHDAKRREPWSFGDPWTQRVRAAIADRYALLPYWYSTFARARFGGEPVMRPVWACAPTDPQALAIDDQWFIGSDLLVKPAVQPGVDSVDVYVPKGPSLFFDARIEHKHAKYEPGTLARRVPAPIDGLGAAVPVFQRGGSIVPRQRRLRRSTVPMRTDPYELSVALDASGKAEGLVYLDDQSTFAFRDDNAFSWTTFEFKANALSASVAVGVLPPALARDRATSLGIRLQENAAFQPPPNIVERIIILGLAGTPNRVVVRDGPALDFAWESASKRLVVRKPQLKVADAWIIDLEF
ncbi:hypothetical protein CTAYLR_003618 [Chrysophaeum taylorii]|uniref:Glucosidase II subunit alpha n=1 Tax=Chrysophaeum taylorii TaxID=2483200 RepID=A0AAD7XNE2_9STRA|nr:hypothetical protein CTAYLR_003618 [Chrysophaeum taylorii]